MTHKILLVVVLLMGRELHAQSGSAEFLAGHSYLHYQHSIHKSIRPGSVMGWQHIATLIKHYETDPEKGGLPDEVMNQFYLSVRVARGISLKGGLFYTNATGFKPSVSAQFTFSKKDWMMVLAPRMDIKKNPSYELFVVSGYSPDISRTWKLYFRIQAMSSVGKFHNRSYQLIRAGFSHKRMQFGAGFNSDFYGRSGIMHTNAGLFVQMSL